MHVQFHTSFILSFLESIRKYEISFSSWSWFFMILKSLFTKRHFWSYRPVLDWKVVSRPVSPVLGLVYQNKTLYDKYFFRKPLSMCRWGKECGTNLKIHQHRRPPLFFITSLASLSPFRSPPILPKQCHVEINLVNLPKLWRVVIGIRTDSKNEHFYYLLGH